MCSWCLSLKNPTLYSIKGGKFDNIKNLKRGFFGNPDYNHLYDDEKVWSDTRDPDIHLKISTKDLIIYLDPELYPDWTSEYGHP